VNKGIFIPLSGCRPPGAALTASDVGSAKKGCGYRLAGAGFFIKVYTARWVFF